jgi:hypothetical protein
MISYRTVRLDGTKVFYREGGDLTLRGSSDAIQLATGLRGAPAGLVRNTFLLVTDLEAAREWLLRCGVQVSEIRHKTPVNTRDGSFGLRLDPEHGDHASFAEFADPGRQHMGAPGRRLSPTPGESGEDSR